jgi:ribosomal protein S27E
MATEVRCETCGKTLWVEDPPGSRLSCPNCTSELTVPRSGRTGILATEPRGVSAPPAGAPATVEVEEVYREGELSERAAGILTTALPWGVSVAFHAGIFLVLLFLFMARSIVQDPDAERIIIPDARLSEDPGALIDASADRLKVQNTKRQRRTKRHTYKKQPARNMLDEVATKTPSDLKIIGIGVGAGGGPSAYGLSAGESEGPRASFYGSGGNAYKVCYVIDRSGSLLDVFDYLRNELKQSIRNLVPQQQFHVIFFAGGRPEEMEPSKLVYATSANKARAFKYLDSIVPGGQTQPGPALERAFKCRPELIYFMTDGDFPPQILDRLRQLNRSKKVKINTLSFVFKPGEQLLRQIASDHGGQYKHVSEDDL